MISANYIFAQKDTIYWQKGYKLKWEDFKGTSDSIYHCEALTFSGIECKYSLIDTLFFYNVAAYFVTSKSWKMPVVSNNTLKHEQLHFDITELFARRLKSELNKIKPNRLNVKNIVRSFVQKEIEEKEKVQDQYDKETDFGRNRTMQYKWQLKIAKLLR